MTAYSVIMFAVSVLFFVVGILICRGKTGLIHSYHREKVTDHAAYGKAFGSGMLVIASSMLASGIIGLLGETKGLITASVSVLFAGLALGIVCIVIAQIKYNKGIF